MTFQHAADSKLIVLVKIRLDTKTPHLGEPICPEAGSASSELLLDDAPADAHGPNVGVGVASALAPRLHGPCAANVDVRDLADVNATVLDVADTMTLDPAHGPYPVDAAVLDPVESDDDDVLGPAELHGPRPPRNGDLHLDSLTPAPTTPQGPRSCESSWSWLPAVGAGI